MSAPKSTFKYARYLIYFCLFTVLAGIALTFLFSWYEGVPVVEVVRLSDGKKLFSIKQFSSVSSIALSPDGRYLAAGERTGTISLWEVSDRRIARKLEVPGNPVLGLTFSQDGALLASRSRDGFINVWNLGNGRLVSKLPRQPDSAVLVFSPDARLLAVGGSGTIKIWNARTGQRVHAWTGHTNQVRYLAFSADGRLLASAGEALDTIRVWNTNGDLLKSVSGRGPIQFSENGRLLYGVYADSPARENVRIEAWSIPSGKKSFERRFRSSDPITFDKSCRLLMATGGSTVRVIRVSDGAVIQEFRGGETSVGSVSVSSDGKLMAYSYAPKATTLWQ